MTFTFLPEDGTALEAANSYVTVEEADDHFLIDLNFAATWSALDEEAKQHQLAWATRVLDQKVEWRGTRVDADSGLRWPRTGVYDRDGALIDDDAVPLQVKQAVCELAKFLMTTDLTAGQDVEYLKRVRVDVLEAEWQDGTGQSALPSLINDILFGLGAMPTGGSRFVRILKT